MASLFYEKAAERQKDLIGFVRSCSFSALNRGLQNLDSLFGKGFNFVRGKLLSLCAESRFAESRTSRKGTVLFFSLVRKERGVPQRFANLWTPGTIQSSAGEDFSKVFRRHEPKPVFRTNRRRKGFESRSQDGVPRAFWLLFARRKK